MNRGGSGRWRVLGTAVMAAMMCAGVTSAATHSLVSGRFALDTRGGSVGTVAGRVMAGGSPVVGAQVRIENTVCATNTGADGTFLVTDVPTGYGYVLVAGADGYGGARVGNINVILAGVNVGDVTLTVATRPYRVIPIVPDVNPARTEVEQGGTGYRYYQLVAADGRTPVGGVPVTVQVQGGSTIPQTGVSDRWAGRRAGISDPDGTLRIEIPASYLLLGTDRTINVLESSVVKQSFAARAVANSYKRVWSHKVGGGVSGFIQGVDAGISGSFETEVKHTVEGTAVVAETIKRSRAGKLSAGTKVGGGVSLGAGVTASARAGAYVSLDGATTFAFDPNATGSGENAMKLMVALGDTMLLAPSPVPAFYEFTRSHYESQYLDDNLQSVEANMRLGGYVEGNAMAGFHDDSVGTVGAHAKLSAELTGRMGIEKIYQPRQETAFILGVEQAMEGSEALGLVFGSLEPGEKEMFGGIGGGVSTKFDLTGKAVTRNGALARIEVANGTTISYYVGPTWKDWGVLDGLNLGPNGAMKFRNKTSFDWSGGTPESPLWSVLKTGGAGTMPICGSSSSELIGGALQMVLNKGLWADYEKSVAWSQAQEGKLKLEVEPGIGFTVSVEGKRTKGFEDIVEHGRLLRLRRMPLESRSLMAADMLPSQEITDLEFQWFGHAIEPLRQAMNWLAHLVNGAGQTIVNVVGGGVNAVLSFAQGVMPGGSQLNSGYVGSGSGKGRVVYLSRPALKASGVSAMTLPPDGSSNWVYGIGGVISFASTNAFVGTGTLCVAYLDSEIGGLDETALRVYRLADDSNTWDLVGGIVEPESNRVWCMIADLGTYTLAPPLPAGVIALDLGSSNAMPSDGVATMMLTASNLVLNTGVAATQAWLYTAFPSGVGIVDPDLDTNMPGVQVAATNGVLLLTVRAPLGGTEARVDVVSVAGDAVGGTGIPIEDNGAPAAPVPTLHTAGQSRVWIAWTTNGEPDIAEYRMYYRCNAAGPPYDGVAAIEGQASPFSIAGTNCLLRGLAKGSNYYLAVSAVDTSGNESPLASVGSVTTFECPPQPPICVASRADDGTNFVMWGLSEDDGYNDRDVIRYDVYRAAMPGGSFEKRGEVGAGIGVFSEVSTQVAPDQVVMYSVIAIDQLGHGSGTKYSFSAPQVHADFDADATNGVVPLTVQFAELCTNSPQYWFWDFDGDGVIDSTNREPAWVYTTSGVYAVSLTASNDFGLAGWTVDTETKDGYIEVVPEPCWLMLATVGTLCCVKRKARRRSS